MMARSSSSRGGHFILFSMAVMLGPLFFYGQRINIAAKREMCSRRRRGGKKGAGMLFTTLIYTVGDGPVPIHRHTLPLEPVGDVYGS